jgi:hypothetical protein
MRNGECSYPKRRQRKKLEFCSYQGRIRANGWLAKSESWRGFFAFLERTNPHPCTPT